LEDFNINQLKLINITT